MISFQSIRSKDGWQTDHAICILIFCLILIPSSIRAEFVLQDITIDTGIDFIHTDGSTGQKYIVEPVSAGLALFDYDNDNDIDVYFLNGGALGETPFDLSITNALYRNDGNFIFTDVTTEAGVGDTGFGLGVVAGDYDNDGNLDLYLNNFGPNILYRNNGDGTFTDVTDVAGVGNGNRVGAGASFLDIDQDGDLDLFVANYLKFSCEKNIARTVRGYSQYAGPLDYPPESNTVYKNNGDGTFSDVTRLAGIADHFATGMGVICADYDNDRDTDIFVANDMLGNFLFRNNGTGEFEEVALISGFAYDLNGNAHSSMGIDCADYDNDGLLDFYVTSYARELATLYRNLGNGSFEDVGLAAGAASSVLPYVTWGTGLPDFDNDGDRDIFIACGHTDDNVEDYDGTTTYRCKNIVLMNSDEGHFSDISEDCGDGLHPVMSSRGIGLDDLDNDGDIDVVVFNSRQKPTILRNETINGNGWVKIGLRGISSNYYGIGAQVRVISGSLFQMAEVHSGRSYQSHYGQLLHFGLGKNKIIDSIEVRWPSGITDTYEGIPINKCLLLREGSIKVQYTP